MIYILFVKCWMEDNLIYVVQVYIVIYEYSIIYISKMISKIIFQLNRMLKLNILWIESKKQIFENNVLWLWEGKPRFWHMNKYTGLERSNSDACFGRCCTQEQMCFYSRLNIIFIYKCIGTTYGGTDIVVNDFTLEY